MGIRIIKAGILDTIQDNGRFGYQHLGINPGGSMDTFSSRLANILAGNSPDDPVIEMHFPASEFLFEKNTTIVLTGADFDPELNGKKIPLHCPIQVGENSILRFRLPITGARCYMGIKGGLAIPCWLDSYSTNLKAKAGGWNGRNLLKDDHIPYIENIYGNTEPVVQSEIQSLVEIANQLNPIFILRGPEWEWLTSSSQEKLLSGSYTIQMHSDRMGYSLLGEPLFRLPTHELISSPVSFGTVQLMHNGQLTILMADHQTTGGYPRILNIISFDLPRLAQKNPGDVITFQLTDSDHALDLLFQRDAQLKKLEKLLQSR